MDPAVRLAYELDQVASLAGFAKVDAAASRNSLADEIAAAAAAAAVAGSVGQQAEAWVGSVPAGLGPVLPWKEMAAASKLLTDAACEHAAACQQATGRGAASSKLSGGESTGGVHDAAASALVECCDLQPGRSYVDFRKDCHMVDVMAHNYTAHAMALQQQHL